LLILQSGFVKEKTVEYQVSHQGRVKSCPFHTLSFFAGLDEDLLALLKAIPSDSLTYQPAQTIYHASTPAAYFYVVREGHVKLFKTTSNGKEQIVKIVRPGEIFGFDGFVDEFYNHSAVALKQVEVCRIPIAQLQYLHERRHEVERLIMMNCIKELQHADERLLELGAKRSGERLASFLLAWCESTPQGEWTPLVLSRLETAQLLGLTIETVSRMFALWKREAVIREEHQAIQIVDAQKLNALAFSD
jgi:CRP/FNR family transcriptional regulator